ncbi:MULTISPECIES: ABC transporter permease [Hydrocarboniphaga]|uniref:Transport permease protein n=1 Tax=Hydrocarboniphaga effusa AP103 TaxID=1172194 RepID=I7ZE58_9GAMM|nr:MULTISPECIES: ABC transporter permease [Hydrocarboniphaga]EIT69957.1 ABC-2 type transporter [Hydrocarboniphaga effusa AP103]EIT70144.1 ABC-2 type transporter [Hydrocarboniphaga effusa AP103]MDZ4078539.1 ABC transporter permease [Hydrocarboniphaga sp.]
MSWSGTWGIVLRQFYLMRGSPTRLLPMFAWVAIDIVLWGYITRYLDTLTQAGGALLPSLLGAVLLWDLFSRVMQGITTSFLEDVWSRNFLNLFASPLSVTDYVAGLVLTSLIGSAIGLIVMLVLAMGIFDLSFVSYGLLLIPFLLVLFLFGIALGIFASAMVLRLGPASEWLVWPIPALLSPFAGVFYPLSTLPGWMQAVGHALPPSYVFEGMRSIVAGQPFEAHTLLWGLGLAVGQILLAAVCFKWVFRYSIRSGLLARYSAESVA